MPKSIVQRVLTQRERKEREAFLSKVQSESQYEHNIGEADIDIQITGQSEAAYKNF